MPGCGEPQAGEKALRELTYRQSPEYAETQRHLREAEEKRSAQRRRRQFRLRFLWALPVAIVLAALVHLKFPDISWWWLISCSILLPVVVGASE